MTEPSAPRVLFCAFAEVPGTTAAGTRMAQWLSVFGSKEMDALALKGSEGAHLQRLGGARIMRVPNAAGKSFLDKLSTYQRALQRQLGGEAYDLVWCGDLFSASTVAAIRKKSSAPLIVEIAEIPSQSELADGDAELKKIWRDAERLAIRSATRVFLPSRHAVKITSQQVDARLVHIIARAVDRGVFMPPTVELDDERLVVLFGGREGATRAKVAVAIAQALAITLPIGVRIGILGRPTPADVAVKTALGNSGLWGRVELIDADDKRGVSAALSLAHVVVVPSSAEDAREPFALPNRALEAMACGRAVVVTGPDAAFKDGAAPREHFVTSPAHDARRVAQAVQALLGDAVRRTSLGRAAAHYIERSADLLSRAQEVQAIVVEATGVHLRLRARAEDEETSWLSASPISSPPSPLELRPSPSAAASPSVASGAMWEGDTFLDGAPGHVPLAIETSPDAVRVRDAMIESTPPTLGRTLHSGGALPTSLAVGAALERNERPPGGDPWGPDTITDGVPIDTGREAGRIDVVTPPSVRLGSLLVDLSPGLRPPTTPPLVDLTTADCAPGGVQLGPGLASAARTDIGEPDDGGLRAGRRAPPVPDVPSEAGTESADMTMEDRLRTKSDKDA